MIPVDENYSPGNVLQEIPVVKDVDLTGNASLGLTIDRERNRVLVAIADVFGNRYSALAAYDLTSWNRIFLTKLSGSGSPPNTLIIYSILCPFPNELPHAKYSQIEYSVLL